MEIRPKENMMSVALTPLLSTLSEPQMCKAEDTITTLFESDSHQSTGVSKGSAPPTVAFVATPPKAAPLQLIGLKPGNLLDIDGTLTADGTGKVLKLNANEFELQATVNIPSLGRGLAAKSFDLKEGKITLSIQLTREGDHYTYSLRDVIGNRSMGSGKSDVVVNNGSYRTSDFFGGNPRTVKTQTLTVKTSEGDLVIKLADDPKGKVTGSVSVPMLPSFINTFDLTRK